MNSSVKCNTAFNSRLCRFAKDIPYVQGTLFLCLQLRPVQFLTLLVLQWHSEEGEGNEVHSMSPVMTTFSFSSIFVYGWSVQLGNMAALPFSAFSPLSLSTFCPCFILWRGAESKSSCAHEDRFETGAFSIIWLVLKIPEALGAKQKEQT